LDVRKNIANAVIVLVALTMSVFALLGKPALGEDNFPIAGTYMQNEVCKGSGSNRELLVTITRNAIESNMGYCTILNVKRDHQIIAAQVQCRIPGGQMILGDIIFRLRDDGAIDFEDQDHTSSAVLHKCAE
jgi:hypothetical protein